MDEPERDRGILTETDRAYLRGETEFEHASSEREARARIRGRIREAVQDFGLVFENLERRDRRQILDEFAERTDETQAAIEGEEPRQGPPELAWEILYHPDIAWYGIFTGGLRSMQAFAFLTLLDDFIEELELPQWRFEALLAELVSAGLRDAYGKKGLVVDADVTIDIHEYDVDPEKVRERFDAGNEDITDQEVEWLIQLRDIDWDEYVEYLKQTRH